MVDLKLYRFPRGRFHTWNEQQKYEFSCEALDLITRAFTAQQGYEQAMKQPLPGHLRLMTILTAVKLSGRPTTNIRLEMEIDRQSFIKDGLAAVELFLNNVIWSMLDPTLNIEAEMAAKRPDACAKLQEVLVICQSAQRDPAYCEALLKRVESFVDKLEKCEQMPLH